MTECGPREGLPIQVEDIVATIGARLGDIGCQHRRASSKGGRGLKSLEGLGLLPHWASYTDFFSQRTSFDSIKNNQTNQTCGKRWDFSQVGRRKTRILGIYFPWASPDIFGRLEKCREIQGGGRGSWMDSEPMRWVE
jgi:hypothetical protein